TCATIGARRLRSDGPKARRGAVLADTLPALLPGNGRYGKLMESHGPVMAGELKPPSGRPRYLSRPEINGHVRSACPPRDRTRNGPEPNDRCGTDTDCRGHPPTRRPATAVRSSRTGRSRAPVRFVFVSRMLFRRA